jgi:hypothetical protein
LAQRHGERPDDWRLNSFLATTDRDPVESLTGNYPKRWHLDEARRREDLEVLTPPREMPLDSAGDLPDSVFDEASGFLECGDSSPLS